jgi:cytoskeleton protein RodZ
MLEATSRSPKEAQDQRAEVGQDIARQLQQARLARGEDLADIARQLHIRPAYLAALEQGQFELSVGRPYLLGFLRSYGTYLGLDGDKLVGALKQWLDQDAASPGPNERKPFVASRRGTAVMVTAALLLVAAVYATGPSILDHIDRGSGAGSAATPGEGMLVTGNTVLQPEDAEQAHSGDATAAPARVSGTLSAARAKASHPSGTKPQADSSIGSASSTGSGEAVAARPAAEPARAPQAPEGAAAAALAGERATPATPPEFAPADTAAAPTVPGELLPSAGTGGAIVADPMSGQPHSEPTDAAAATPPDGGATVTSAKAEPDRALPPSRESDSSRTASSTRPALASSAGRFAVHLASVRDPAVVAGEWRRLAEHHPSLARFEPRPPLLVAIPGKGTFYRVAGGAFATKAEAQALCEHLRAQHQYCRVITP